MWGIRVFVPKKQQESVLKKLHRDHQGIAKMKANAIGATFGAQDWTSHWSS